MRNPRQVQVLSALLLLLLSSLAGQAQHREVTNGNAVVPPLVNFNGVLTDLHGKPLTVVTPVTFSLYQNQEAGAPLWTEVQNVQPDQSGRYGVLLGSTTNEGLPSSVFAAGEARWLGVQVAGQPEQTRVLLVSVPYALKAVDAQTVGGLPPSAFLLAAPGSRAEAPGANIATPVPALAGTGIQGFIPLWTDSVGDLGNSVMFQTGSGATARIGINTSTPGATLDVAGAALLRGVVLPSTGTATATSGLNSDPFYLEASSFNSGTGKPNSEVFQWQAEPTGNNTVGPSGTLNLLFGANAKPAETGLSIGGNGLITFAAGQTFPGTGNGTITGVTAGTDLTGGGTSGSVTLNLNTTATDKRYAQLNAANTFTGNQIVSGGVGATGNFTSLGNLILGGGAVVGTSLGVSTASPRATLDVYGNATDTLVGDPGCGTGYAGIGFTASGGFTGCTNYALLGGSKGATYINSSGTASIHFRSNNNELATIDNSGNVNVIGQNGGGNLTVAANLTVSGQVNSGPGGKFTGFTAPSGSSGNGRNGIVANGGDGDLKITASSPATTGGDGVRGVGGKGVAVLGGGDGVGGVFTGGNNGANGNAGFAGGGDGVDAFAGSGEAAFLSGGGNFGIILNAVGVNSATQCIIDVNANLACIGSKSAVVPVDGARKVKLYAIEAPENWFEDFGSGRLANGVASITLDPTFAQTVNSGTEYHVFVTPRGECEGLYVSNANSAGFEVRELRHGASNTEFDYQIVAKRRGYENLRMEDVTEMYKKMEARNELRRKRAAVDSR